MWSHVCLMPAFQSQGGTNLHQRVISSHCLIWKCEENSTSSCVYIFAFCIYVLSWAILFYSAHRGAHLALLQEFLFRFSYGLRAMPNSPWYWKIIIKQCRDVTKPKRVSVVAKQPVLAISDGVGPVRTGRGQRRSSDVLLGPCSEYGIQANYLIVSIDSYVRYPHSSSLAVTLLCLICVCIILNCKCKFGFCLDIFLSYILNIVQDELSYHGLLP